MCALSTTHLINIFTLKDTINVFSNHCAGTFIYLVGLILQFADHVWLFKHHLCTSNADDATLSVCPLCCL